MKSWLLVVLGLLSLDGVNVQVDFRDTKFSGGTEPLPRNPNGNTPLHAALAGDFKLVAGLLIGGGADVNATDAAGWRPLHLAAGEEHAS
ncbi:ankyrin repeat domain-containing protein [Lacticaseibacillus rhamnosus]